MDRVPSPDAPRACILVVDDQEPTRDRLARMLERRFGPDYSVVAATSAVDGLAALDAFVGEGTDVALILARQRMAETTGVAFLAVANTKCPGARRALVLGTRELSSARDDILRAAAVGEIDTYIVMPEREADEQFFFGRDRAIEEVSRLVTLNRLVVLYGRSGLGKTSLLRA